MATKTRDIRLQSLVLGGVPIPLGGDGVSARVAMGPVGSVTRGVATSIKERPGQREGVLTITVYPEDAAETVLRQLYNQRRAPGADAVPLAGVATVTLVGVSSTVQTAKWADAHFTAVPDMVLGTTSETGTYELALVDAEIVTGGA